MSTRERFENEVTFGDVAWAIEEDRKARHGRKQPPRRRETPAEIAAEQARVDAMFGFPPRPEGPLGLASSPPPRIWTRGVLAGAYKGRNVSERALLTHALESGKSWSLCGRIEEERLSDLDEETGPTCPLCAKRLAARKKKTPLGLGGG